MNTTRPSVLIAGIAGASLGTELLKCLIAANRYVVYGCDVSPYAYGHYDGFEKTFLVDRTSYVGSVLEVCRKHRIEFVVPGADEPSLLLSASQHRFKESGVHVASNTPELVQRFSNKASTFETLAALGFPTPQTLVVKTEETVRQMNFPCVVKPVTGTGGSAYVFLASDADEAQLYVRYIVKSGRQALLQEYVPHGDGEFTVGVVSYPDATIATSIALRRLFEHKLSVLQRSSVGVISSGYSEGLIDAFPEVCDQAAAIATAVGSKGPLNIQGRMRNGTFVPFEINPRFSASVYLRTLAGVNEVDLYLHNVITGERKPQPRIKTGYYLRSLTELFVEPERLLPH